MKVKYLIIGSGMAGLGAGIALNKAGYGKDTLILEANNTVGGLNTTTQVMGCDFDMGPKILLLGDDENSKEILSYLGDNVVKYPVEEKVYLKGIGGLLDFPLQRYLVELPFELRETCLNSFRRAQMHPREVKSFKDWLINGFGETFANMVLIPYEEKKWQMNLDEMDYKWALDRPIKVNADEIEEGAKRKLEPNRSYFYPKYGNINTLTNSMAKEAGAIVLGAKVVSVNTLSKEVMTEDGKIYEYEYLISTLPLDTFVYIDKEMTSEILHTAKAKLRRLSIKVFNLVFKGEHDLEGSAIYFPDKEIIFRRLSILKNICPALHREGFTTISAEVSISPDNKTTDAEFVTKVMDDLYSMSEFNRLEGYYLGHGVLNVDFAYPLQLNGLIEAVKKIHGYYLDKNVYHCGRGGSYNYCNSDVAYKQGKDVVEGLLK